MTDQLTQQQVNQTAWAACDTFRGVVDAGQYKDYILVMLFLKYISDHWKDHLETYRKQYGGDEIRIRRRLERERFVLPEGASFYDLYEARNEPNIGERINVALERIEDANRAKLEGVFRNIDFNSEANLGRVKDRNRRLKNVLEDFAKPALDLRPSRVTEDIIGECYIYLISRFASDAGKKAGEFYTPSAVSRLLAKLAAPKPGGTICDPACGSGSLLIRAAEEVGSENFALYGQEVNGATWALARMMARYKTEDEYTRQIIDAFKGSGDPEILIVVSKLLTGFDAPRNTVLYVCKSLREHNLLQAIARVNRLYEDGATEKQFGFIIDYEGLLGELDTALTTCSAFEGFGPTTSLRTRCATRSTTTSLTSFAMKLASRCQLR